VTRATATTAFTIVVERVTTVVEREEERP